MKHFILILYVILGEEGEFIGYQSKIFNTGWELNTWLKKEASDKGIKRFLYLEKEEDIQSLFSSRRIKDYKEGDAYIFGVDQYKPKEVAIAWEV